MAAADFNGRRRPSRPINHAAGLALIKEERRYRRMMDVVRDDNKSSADGVYIRKATRRTKRSFFGSSSVYRRRLHFEEIRVE